MKKRGAGYNHNRMDRNHTAINGNFQRPQRSNIVNPEFLLGQLWIQEQENNGLKIIELDSNSSNNDLNDDEDTNALSHAWSYINQDRFRISQSPENDYKVNHKARDRHRQKTERNKQEINSSDDEEGEESCIKDFYYSNFQEPENNNSVNRNHISKRKVDCFTNILPPYPNTSDSSTDVEYIDRSDSKAEVAWNAEDRYYDEILTYDSNTEAEKRTIYIYSFKNKHLFAENNVTNVSNVSSSTNTDVSEGQIEDKSNERVPSPMPNIYVPKLNLLQPPKLSTVAEITEPKSSEENFQPKINTKNSNGWFPNTTRRYEDKEYKCDSNNLINWMSLSPREKRRRSINTFCENCKHLARLQSVRKASQIPEEDVHNAKSNFGDKSEDLGNISNIDDNNPEDDSKIQRFNDIWIEENRVDDKGDHLQNKSLQKPKIQISPQTSEYPIKITEPLEKLDSNNWIGNEIIVARDKSSSHQMRNTDAIENRSNIDGDASRRLWENNMVFMKPSEWSAFYPVDNSVPSLHLSLETETEDVTWFRRIIRCLKCFK